MDSALQKMTDEEILSKFEESSDPVLTAAEIASEAEMTRQAISRRLEKLKDEGYLSRKKVGGRAVVWWVSV